MVEYTDDGTRCWKRCFSLVLTGPLFLAGTSQPSASPGRLAPPAIQPAEAELVLDAGEQLSLTCADLGFVKWTFESLGQQSEHRNSHWVREKAEAAHTGQYTCTNADGLSSSIYVFVRGECDTCVQDP